MPDLTGACSNCPDVWDKDLARCMAAGDTVAQAAADACYSTAHATRGKQAARTHGWAAAEDGGIDRQGHGKETAEASKGGTAERTQAGAALQIGGGRAAGVAKVAVAPPAACCSSAGWVARPEDNCSLFSHQLKT